MPASSAPTSPLLPLANEAKRLLRHAPMMMRKNRTRVCTPHRDRAESRHNGRARMGAYQCANLCFNGGVCSPEGRCICPPDSGFSADLSFFHDANCSFPVGLYRTAMIASAVITAVCLAILWPFFKRANWSNKHVRRLHLCALGIIIVNFFAAVSLYAQDGCFEAAIAVSIITAWCLVGMLISYLQLLVLPVFSHSPSLRRAAERYQLLTQLSIAVLMTFMGIAEICFVRADDASFNNLMRTGWLVTAVLAMYEIIVMETGLRAVLRILHSVPDDSTRVFVHRLERVRVLVRAVVLPFALLALGIAIVHIALGSFPYFYSIVLCQFLIGFPFDAVLVIVVFGSHTRRVGEAAGRRGADMLSSSGSSAVGPGATSLGIAFAKLPKFMKRVREEQQNVVVMSTIQSSNNPHASASSQVPPT